MVPRWLGSRLFEAADSSVDFTANGGLEGAVDSGGDLPADGGLEGATNGGGLGRVADGGMLESAVLG